MRNTKIIGEIGINHNGSVETTKELINMAKVAGCDYVKFQKRTPEICVPEEQKLLMRDQQLYPAHLQYYLMYIGYLQ